ncbi:MAG: hypothetical protein ACI8UP_001630 [Porticoccaceae bacterium]|jgi:hypothetical protein
MSMQFQKPEEKALVEMLDMMLGASTKATVSSSYDAASTNYTAIYANNDGDTVATCRLALPTAAALGCALSMIPPGAAESMVEDKELTQTATENLYEVMNMFSSLLMNDKSSHLKLNCVSAANDASIEGTAFEFTIDMGKYGSGQILFNVA